MKISVLLVPELASRFWMLAGLMAASRSLTCKLFKSNEYSSISSSSWNLTIAIVGHHWSGGFSSHPYFLPALASSCLSPDYDRAMLNSLSLSVWFSKILCRLDLSPPTFSSPYSLSIMALLTFILFTPTRILTFETLGSSRDIPLREYYSYLHHTR